MELKIKLETSQSVSERPRADLHAAIIINSNSISVFNSFILFREHQKNNPDNPALKGTSEYSQNDFREEIIRGICGFPDYDDPLVSTLGQLAKPANLWQNTFQFRVSIGETVWSATRKVGVM